MKDRTCNGTGFLWVDSYGNAVTCWRCAGSGITPSLVPEKEAGSISNETNGLINEANIEDK